MKDIGGLIYSTFADVYKEWEGHPGVDGEGADYALGWPWGQSVGGMAERMSHRRRNLLFNIVIRLSNWEISGSSCK